MCGEDSLAIFQDESGIVIVGQKFLRKMFMLENTRIVIVRLSSIGDVLHTTPVARALKTALPSCYLTWVVGEVSADLVRYNPFIDEVYVWSRALQRGYCYVAPAQT